MCSKKTFIIAELSANHNGSLDRAIETIRAAKQAGADAIKFQTYTADTITLDSDNELFRIEGGLWDGRYLHDLYSEAYTPWEWHEELFRVAREEDLVCFSSPFDYTAVDFLETLNNPIYKIASFEIVDIPLIEYTAAKGKPMIISTGIATFDEIVEAVEACHRVGNVDITLLKCTSSYPAPIDEANLLIMADLREKFGVKVGLSDHTLGANVAIAAVALGAEVIEKHFIIDRSMGGADSAFSMEPTEFSAMVSAIRDVEKSLGKITYEITPKVAANRRFARSLFVCEDIKAGEKFTTQNVRSVRPSDGLPPKYLPVVLGKTAAYDIKAGTPFAPDMIF